MKLESLELEKEFDEKSQEFENLKIMDPDFFKNEVIDSISSLETLQKMKQNVKWIIISIREQKHALNLQKNSISHPNDDLNQDKMTNSINLIDLNNQNSSDFVPIKNWIGNFQQKASNFSTKSQQDFDNFMINYNLLHPEIHEESKQIKSETQEDKKQTVSNFLLTSNLCLVCWENPRSVVFHPCKHLVCCEKCAKGAVCGVCPFCRCNISSHDDVFVP